MKKKVVSLQSLVVSVGANGNSPICPHKHKELRTLAHYCTVEVTALFCKECGKQLTKEQWEV